MKRKTRHTAQLEPTVIAIAVASCFAASPALANPSGATVVNGQVSFHQQGNLLQITNSPNAIINWQSFSIGAGEITRFMQQSASSAVLNRVISQNPSSILGALQSNGRVFLINPNGILFGAGAQIDVAGLVASTLNLSNADFLAGRLKFTEVPGAGSVVNQGNITTGAGGQVYLVGPGVTNSGLITSPKGEVVLAAGNSVELVDPGTPNLRVAISAPDNEARNLGRIVAEAGRVGIYAGLINHAGTIRADSAVVGENGQILLKATKNATLEAGSVTTANGPNGGSIMVQSGDTTLVSGTIEAKGLGSPPSQEGVAQSAGVAGKGGTVEVLGNRVGLIDNASINASGETGGGTVLIGGDFQGKNPEAKNAFRTYVGPNTMITADAVLSGDGGKVIVWSDDATRFYGSISARGGAQGGNGGFVEVSGKQFLDFNGRVDVGAPAGRAGTILLDPRDIIIRDAVGPQDAQVADSTVLFADSGGSTDFTISDEALEALTGSIVLQAQQDITVNAGLSGGGLNFANQTAGERVVLQAGRDININSPLTTNGAAIILEADSPHQPGGADGIGKLNINAPVNSCAGQVPAACSGGAITLFAGAATDPTKAGFGLDADVNAGTGGINVALSQTSSTLDFHIGAGGNAQLSDSDTGALKTTGALVLGTATTAGADGLGAGALTVTVNSLDNDTSNGVNLSPASGSSFQLVAGGGGILLGRDLTTFQNTIITTSGPLTLNNATLNTSNNDLTITASSVALSNGSINTGSGVFFCSAVSGCPASATGVLWAGTTGPTPGDGVNWFDPLNWSTDAVPDNTRDVRIDAGFGTIVVNGAAAAKSLVANSPMEVSAGQSLTLTNASQFNHTFTLSGGSLAGPGSVTVGGANGGLTWSGGTMASGGGFSLASGRSGTLSGALTLDRQFSNSGTVTLSGAAAIGGTGMISNSGTWNKTLAGTATVAPAFTNASTGIINANAGTLQINSFASSSNAGTINIASGATLSTNGSALTNAATGVIAGAGTLDLGSATLTNQGTLRPGGSPGTLNITGNLTMTSTSVTDIEVRSPWTTAGTDFDLITVSGTATLAGALNVIHFDGITPPTNQQMQVLDATAVTGTFATVNPPFGSTYTALYNPANVTLRHNALAINNWNTDLDGDWNVASNWTLGVPIAGQAVRINRPSGSPTVTMNSLTPSILQFDNAETFTLNSSTLNIAAASSNTGTLNLNSSALGGAGSLANQGTVTVNNSTLSVPILNSSPVQFSGGTNTITSGNGITGGTVEFLGGTTTFQAGSTYNVGTTNISVGTANFDTAATTAILNLSSGTLGSTGGSLTVNGAFNWSGGTLAGAGTLATSGGATFNITGSGVRVLNGLTVNANNLTLGGGSLDLVSGTLNTTGTTNISSGALLGLSGGTLVLGGPMNVAGTLDLNTGAFNFAAGGTHTGTFDVAAATALNLSGTHNLDAGATLTGAGTLANNGTLNVNANATIPSGLAAFNNSGRVNVTAGTLQLAGSGTDTGDYQIAAGTTLQLTGGTRNWNDIAMIIAGSAGVFDLAGGTLNVNATNTVPAGFGAFNVTGGSLNIPSGVTLGVNNLNLDGGSLRLQSGTLNASGTTSIAGGATLIAQGGTFNAAGGIVDVSGVFEAAGGSVTAGTINVQAGGMLRGGGAISANVNNTAGTLAPGTSAGTLTINGNYTQGPAGTLAVEIGGTAPGTQYDQLIVTGNATLDGTLNVALISGYAPTVTETYMVIQSGGTVTGTFATTNLPTTPAFSTNYLVSSVNVTTAGVVAPPAVVQQTQQTVVTATEQSTSSQTAAAAAADPKKDEEEREQRKKPVCSGSSSGGGGAAGARPVMSGGGGGGGRCTARGCF